MGRGGPTANDYAMAWLRITIGFLFLIFAQYKILGSAFIYGGGFEGWIHSFLKGGVYPFMTPVLQNLVLPHARFFAIAVSYSELCIGLALTFGILVRAASFGGLVYMLALLFSSNYPGEHAPVWEYFGASLNHLVLALCFLAFGMGNAARVWSISNYVRRKYGSQRGPDTDGVTAYYAAPNSFGK
ncbi:MAG: DoxX family protein [Acidobacteriota bacterium]|nr:DoxX family protein [Acidobacteriota bacterium]